MAVRWLITGLDETQYEVFGCYSRGVVSGYESVGLEECLGREGQVGVPPV